MPSPDAAWVDSFDHGATAAYTVTGSVSVITTPRTGSRAFQLAATSSQAAFFTTPLRGLVFPNPVGAAQYLRFSSAPDADMVLCFARTQTNNRRAGLAYNSATGKIRGFVESGGSFSYTADGPSLPTDGQWHAYQFKARMQTAPVRISIDNFWLDGAAAGQSVEVEPGVTTGPFSLGVMGNGIGGNANATFDVDDVFWWNTAVPAGSPFDAPVADYEVRYLLLDGVGTPSPDPPTNFLDDAGNVPDSTTWQRLDDDPATSTTDYVRQTAVATSDYLEFTPADLSSTAGTPLVVGCIIQTQGGGTGGAAAESHYVDGPRTRDPILHSFSSSAVIYQLERVATRLGASDPAWDPSGVNALLYRWGYSSDATPSPRLHFAAIQPVCYTAAPGYWGVLLSPA